MEFDINKKYRKVKPNKFRILNLKNLKAGKPSYKISDNSLLDDIKENPGEVNESVKWIPKLVPPQKLGFRKARSPQPSAHYLGSESPF